MSIVRKTSDEIPETSKERHREIEAITDDEIEYSDIPELTEEFWHNATLISTPKKTLISLRVDEDILEWFRSRGKGYQSLMNSVLRTFMTAVESREENSSE